MLGKTTFLISARYLQSAGIFLVTALLLLPPAPYQNITSGLDNSWVTIMNHAVQQHWVFGRDITSHLARSPFYRRDFPMVFLLLYSGWVIFYSLHLWLLAPYSSFVGKAGKH
jgi:hypothetical protein